MIVLMKFLGDKTFVSHQIGQSIKSVKNSEILPRVKCVHVSLCIKS